MTKPSKGAAAFFIFFGLMFLVPGLLSLFTFLANSRNHSTSGTIAGAAIALLISAIGVGFLFVAVGGYRRMNAQAAVEEANPSSPWLWRTDWASRRAESQRKKSEITAWVVCIFSNLVMIPLAVTIVSQLARKNDPRVFLVLGFALIGAILLVVASRATLRRQRFGNTFFELYSLPFSPGGRLAGRIHLKLDSNAAHGIDLRLSCVRKMITGSGDSRSTSQTVLWQTEQNIPLGAVEMDSVGRMIPVDFAIPPDAYVTDHDNPSDQVLWLLHAKADIPGIDYTDDFELPVFKTSSAAEQSSHYSSSETLGPKQVHPARPTQPLWPRRQIRKSSFLLKLAAVNFTSLLFALHPARCFFLSSRRSGLALFIFCSVRALRGFSRWHLVSLICC